MVIIVPLASAAMVEAFLGIVIPGAVGIVPPNQALYQEDIVIPPMPTRRPSVFYHSSTSLIRVDAPCKQHLQTARESERR